MSRYSPGLVTDGESVVRLLFHPIQIDSKKNRVKPSAFTPTFTRGCSVQRDDKASNEELVPVVTSILAGADERQWYGALRANVQRIRDISLMATDEQSVCVYDTSEPSNRAHAELCAAVAIEDDGNANELRRLLGLAFNADHPIEAKTYRAGVIDLLPLEYQSRCK